jgi:hypothetical protein
MIVSHTSAYTIALFNSYLLKQDGLKFVPVAGAGLPTAPLFRSLTTDDGGRLYLAHDGGVVESGDDGESWTPFSDGLPAMPHCADIYSGHDSDGSCLYLATWGRSVFRFAL